MSGRAARVLLTVVLAIVSLLASAKSAFATLAVPPYELRCTDQAGLLTSAERDDLERRLLAYEEGTGHQIAILIVPSLEGEAIEDFSFRVAKAWKLGQKGKDDGVLITVAKAERRARIEVGKGLEGDLTDLESDLIIREKMRPFTKAEKWHDGLAVAVAEIEKKISGKVFGPAPPDVPARPHAKQPDYTGWFFAIVLVLVMLWIFFGRGGRGGGGGGPFIFFGGGGGGFGGGGFGGGGGGGFSPPSGGGGDFGGGGASDDV